MRRRLISAVFSIFITLLFLLCLELFFRLYPFKRPAHEKLFGDIYSVELSMLPNAINPYYPLGLEVLNRYGFRGRAVELQKPVETFRIICLGDSVTFGAVSRADQTYPAYLEQMLAQRFKSSKFEVINGGIPGTNIYQHIMILQGNLLRFNPDMVIVWSSANFMKQVKDYRDMLANPPWHWKLRRLLRHSALYRQMLQWIKGGPREKASFEILNQLRQKKAAEETLVPHMWESYMSDYRQDIIQLKELSIRYGFQLVFTDYPSRYSVLENPGRESFPEQILREFCRENGLLYIDITTPLSAIADESFYSDPIHPTAIGNKAIAKIIMDSLIANGKLPTIPSEKLSSTVSP